ncbi:hypothetical protein DW685_10645 [Lachnospiraceae bacterium AM25-40]|nr:hypothetical protein DW675_11055 [Lachnospiraceae bacterium AM25-22]RJW10938.1 hypothetical protein DW685_10645 [Lachnospiraceae bacterium AM25-40]RJW15201.1 hypothetical protein DW684_10370 [Lachnospiraceae bacterium AM25-39]
MFCVSFFVLFAILLFAGFLMKKVIHKEETPMVVSQIKDYKGYTRIVSREEYQFYQSFVEKENPKKKDRQYLDKKTREYANYVNAEFYVGSKLGLCDPYSFEHLKLQMEQENDSRKVKIANGEKVYGLEEFTLQTFFQYQRDELELGICNYLQQNVDKAMIKAAKKYYEEGGNKVKIRSEVVYEVTQNSVTKTITADREQLNFLGKSDMGLADFLETGNINDLYHDEKDNQEREVIIKDVKYEVSGFEENQDAVIYSYIRTELYPEMIQTVAENNSAEFE